MKNSTFNTQKIDPVSTLLWIFTFFIISLFIYLYSINNNIKNYFTYYNKINELTIINKEFNNFLLKQTSFVNYDNVNKEVNKFQTALDIISSKNSPYADSIKYQQLLKKLKLYYKNKLSSLEYFKSESSQFLYSMHYLYDLNDVIKKSTTLDIKTKKITNNTLLHLMKYCVNPNIDTKKIFENLNILDSTNNDYIKLFVAHSKIDIKRVKEFNEINNIQVIDKLKNTLDELIIYINTDYDKNTSIVKVIVVTLFFVALIILILLIIINKKSTNLKDELVGFQTAIQNSYNSIVITDIDSNITYVNDVAQKDTGYTREELLGQNPRVLKSGLNDDNFYQELHDDLEAGKKWEGVFINKKKDGSLLYEKASIMPIYKYGEIVNYLAIKLNITDYVQEKDKVSYMAYHDSLTSLPNRTNVEEYLKNRISIASRHKSKLALLFIDLDRFKIINDTLGHDVGDELLIEVAKRLTTGLRKSDMLARVGGDEFVIVIDTADNSYSASYVCEKILGLFSQPILTSQHSLSITLSIGVSIFPNDDIDYKQLFKYADIAMYEAKKSGKNTYRYYQEKLSLEAHSRLDLEQSLKEALHNSEIYMMYQPKYDLVNHNIIGLEALARWENKKLGLVSPDKFIPIAEETGYIIEIGLFIFERSCRDFLSFKEYSKTLKSISINISAVQLYQDSFIDDIRNIVNSINISTKEIVLEITETHIMKNIVQSGLILKNLKELGFKISIDDFGTGHSSLSYLKLFPIDELKIDKSFVDDLPNDKNDVAISKSILTLSQSMGYVNVAEGIEDEEQEEFLRTNNCSLGQGYYFCKPKIKDDLIEFIKGHL